MHHSTPLIETSYNLSQQQLGLYWRDFEVKVMILTRNLHMLQDILEPKVENKN